MRNQPRSIRARAGDLAWIAVPFLFYLALLRLLWFDAPVGDDYEAILDGTLHLMDASTLRERIDILLGQHNEHRVAVTRLVAWVAAVLGGGHVDFRLLVLAGNLALAAILVLFWAEFRERTPVAFIVAAGFLLCQLTYFEGALMSMAAISNIGVLAFAFACLWFALKPGHANAALALAFGVLAAGSQGNGLFALPIACIGCALRAQRRRAWHFAAVAAVLWVLYMASYHRPPNHPSVMEAFQRPLDALHLFVVFVGSMVPGVGPATAAGTVLLAALGWLATARFWKQHPAAALWIAFILLSAAAATASRVGFGVFHASRYSINSSCLAAILLLLVASKGWNPRASLYAVGAAALASLALSSAVWPKARAYSVAGHLLAKAMPESPDVRSDPYFGLAHPGQAYGMGVLARAEARGLYRPPGKRVYATAARHGITPRSDAAIFGHVDLVQVAGTRVHALGWTDITAEVPGRVFVSHGPEAPLEARVVATSRTDLAAMAPRLVFGGFRWEAEYASEEQAAHAAQSLCLELEAPGYQSRRFAGHNTGCSGGLR